MSAQIPPRASLEEAISETDREINVRKRCYDRWVQDGKLTSVDARDRLDRLVAAAWFLNEMLKAQHAQKLTALPTGEEIDSWTRKQTLDTDSEAGAQ